MGRCTYSPNVQGLPLTAAKHRIQHFYQQFHYFHLREQSFVKAEDKNTKSSVLQNKKGQQR